METELKISCGDNMVVSVSGDVSEKGDLARLLEQLILEFRRQFPQENLFGEHIKIEVDKAI